MGLFRRWAGLKSQVFACTGLQPGIGKGRPHQRKTLGSRPRPAVICMTKSKSPARPDQLSKPLFQAFPGRARITPVSMSLRENTQHQEGIVQLVDVPNSGPGVVRLLLNDQGVQ